MNHLDLYGFVLLALLGALFFYVTPELKKNVEYVRLARKFHSHVRWTSGILAILFLGSLKETSFLLMLILTISVAVFIYSFFYLQLLPEPPPPDLIDEEEHQKEVERLREETRRESEIQEAKKPPLPPSPPPKPSYDDELKDLLAKNKPK